MALISWVTVRRGLRPLEEIGDTAGAIAGGDLSRRVDETDPRTEVGRLGHLAERDARSHRGGDGRAPRLGGGAAAIPRRRLARAAHAAHVDPRLRRAVPPRRGEGSGRHGRGDAPDRAGERADGSARRRPALPGALGPRPPDRARPGGSRGAWRPTPCTTRGRSIPRGRSRSRRPEHLVVAGDDRRLRQVFANLLSNALVHTPAGTPVAVTVREDAAGWRQCEVSRPGAGPLRRGSRARLRPVLPRRPVARRTRRRRTRRRDRARPRHRGGDRRGARWRGLCNEHARHGGIVPGPYPGGLACRPGRGSVGGADVAASGSGTQDDPWVLKTAPGDLRLRDVARRGGRSAHARVPGGQDAAGLPAAMPRGPARDAEGARRLDAARFRRRAEAGEGGNRGGMGARPRTTRWAAGTA